jgi:hypothetical protein
MSKAKGCILGIDLTNPTGTVTPGGVVILYGDAPVWKYCNWFHRAIAEGAAVVAIGHEVDVFGKAAGCIVAYSTVEEYTIGKPISQYLGEAFSFGQGGVPIDERKSFIAVSKINSA